MQQIVQDTLSSLALATLTLLGSYALYYTRKAINKLSAETAKITNDDQRLLAQAAVARLDDIATKTVKTIEQTTAKELRRAVKMGQVPKEDLSSLAKTAYDEIMCTMEPDYLDALKNSLGDFEKYIKTTIEAKVLELKQNAAIAEALELRED